MKKLKATPATASEIRRTLGISKKEMRIAKQCLSFPKTVNWKFKEVKNG